MRRTLISLFLYSVSLILYSQHQRSENIFKTSYQGSKGTSIAASNYQHELGLHGLVTWLSESKVRVEYDWSDDSQLLDWTTTNGSTLVRGSNNVTVTGGVVSVRSMVWNQLLKCTRLYAEDAVSINAEIAHLNLGTNVIGWTGLQFNPPEIIGLIYMANGNLWVENGNSTTFTGPRIVSGESYNININISDLFITTQSSSDNVVYSHSLNSPPNSNRQVVIGGWGGNTQWGKIIIEGEITPPIPLPSDMINIQSTGAMFSPVIDVTGDPLIEWIFDDSSVSTSASPVKNYGSAGSRNNYLKVTPWSALIGINAGYDAGDGGYGGFAMVPNQYISGFQNLTLAANSLQYICASYSPLTYLDLTGLTELKFIELLYCTNLATLILDTHPVLERICVEDCNLNYIDLSGCPGLEDLRSALNNYTSINWGTIGSVLWHICIRDNPKLTENLPDMTQFPSLTQLLTWNDNQSGAFICHSSLIQRIDIYDNHYTSADITGCTSLREFSLAGNQIDLLNLGTPNSLVDLDLKDCGLTDLQVDNVLLTLDGAARTNGILDLSGNDAPTETGLVNLNSLIQKGWTIIYNNTTGIVDRGGKDKPIKIIVSDNEIKMILNQTLISWKADLYNFKGDLLSSKFVDSDILIIDVSNYPPGMYFVKLSNGQNKMVERFIRQ